MSMSSPSPISATPILRSKLSAIRHPFKFRKQMGEGAFVDRGQRRHAFSKAGGKGLGRKHGINLVGGAHPNLKADLVMTAGNLNQLHSLSPPTAFCGAPPEARAF